MGRLRGQDKLGRGKDEFLKVLSSFPSGRSSIAFCTEKGYYDACLCERLFGLWIYEMHKSRMRRLFTP